MTQEKDEKSLVLFGRDISKIPCFRNSLLYGIGGGLFCGLTRFMFTSQTLRSVNFSVYSFTVITLGYWFQCRYNYSKAKFEMMRLQELLKTHSILEGTAEAEILEKEFGTKPVDI
ncbi:cytochrome c oxidase assembly protein COX20, mitochondrial [Diorhabda carinulata]|uniref:cytochrome c oxidase assembly protein COX20, mitochondrial n=1 Tax=Diorhabda sublineata TaxID=1163346 RepID=UPI0024E086D9|nr:cytochrome c oxidase assembly protein COX20, mitochondrial [Diorhabda sublineata]XP_057669224.1 cytochrome c oxidase assembly protein COX20, mitochondrial [Diorhabda carinulata]